MAHITECVPCLAKLHLMEPLLAVLAFPESASKEKHCFKRLIHTCLLLRINSSICPSLSISVSIFLTGRGLRLEKGRQTGLEQTGKNLFFKSSLRMLNKQIPAFNTQVSIPRHLIHPCIVTVCGGHHLHIKHGEKTRRWTSHLCHSGTTFLHCCCGSGSFPSRSFWDLD